jgi:hypothetical protein
MASTMKTRRRVGGDSVLCTAQRLTACVSVLEILAARRSPRAGGRGDGLVRLVRRLVVVIEGWEFWIGGRLIGRGGAEDAVFLDELAQVCADVHALAGEAVGPVLARLAHELGDIRAALSRHVREAGHAPDEADAYRHLGKFMAAWRG